MGEVVPSAAITCLMLWSSKGESRMSLSASQRKHLLKRLHEERDRVQRDLAEFARTESEDSRQDRGSDLSHFPTHAADLGTDAAEEEVEASIATRQSAELQQIDDAIERLTENPEAYGVCENTGEAIPFERLDIIPWARTTVESATP